MLSKRSDVLKTCREGHEARPARLDRMTFGLTTRAGVPHGLNRERLRAGSRRSVSDHLKI